MLKALSKNSHKPGQYLSRVIQQALGRDRRNYGQDIRLWNDRDPRADQSFFYGSVPGFVIGSDQTIVDWNVGFELVFGSSPNVRRGMPVGEWFELIDNFRRLPNREEKLQGDAVVPITDRERVVFLSPKYGRMVFMKLMSPIIDRNSGRIIGWNVALNVNSVHERVRFFSDLNEKISSLTKHTRFVLGTDQLFERASVLAPVHQALVQGVKGRSSLLVLGSLGATTFVEEILNQNPEMTIFMLDSDAESLRNVKQKLSRFGKQIVFMRRDPYTLDGIPTGKFDGAVVLFPRMRQKDYDSFVGRLSYLLRGRRQVITLTWHGSSGQKIFFESLRRDLEQKHQIDLIRWHLNVVEESFAQRNAVILDQATFTGNGLALRVD